MKTLTTEEAFAAYEAVRGRLPPAGPPGAARRIGSIEDVADRFDVFLLDAFGVLNIGETAIPGVAARIERLRARGKRVLVVTNAAGYPHDLLMARYDRLGYSFDPADVVSSRATLSDAIGGHELGLCGLMVSRATGIGDFASLRTLRLAEAPEDYARADGFVFLGSAEWSETRQRLLEDALRDRPRPVLVANPYIRPARAASRSSRGISRIGWPTGRARRRFFDLSAISTTWRSRRCGSGIDKARVLMVGDSLPPMFSGRRRRASPRPLSPSVSSPAAR